MTTQIAVRPRHAALVAVVAFLVPLAVWAAAAPAASDSCLPKVTKIKGHTAVVNCGPATATLRISGKTYTFKNGTCRTRANGLPLIQLGTALVGTKNNGGYPQFQLAAETRDNASVSADSGSLHLSALVGKWSGKKIVAFSGHSSSSNVSFSGSVNCHGVIQKLQ